MGEFNQNSLVPYFEPLHPGVIFQCQLCGRHISEDDYVTREARRRRMTAQGGDYIFCQGCAPYFEQITQKVSAEGARLDAEHEASRGEVLKALALQLLTELRGKFETPGSSPADTLPPRTENTVATPPARSVRRRIPGVSIPVPE